MIHVFYEQTPDEGGDFLEITDRVNLSNRNLKCTTNAEMASVGTNSFVVDDPDGDLYLTGHRRIFIQEDECDPENDLIFWGYTADRTVSRGSETPVLAARQWDVNITDINTIVGRRVMGGNDADRGEETDIARMSWMFGTSEAVNFTDNTTFVPSSPTVDMSDADYNGQYVQSIVDDCSQQSGRNYYVRWIFNDTPDPHYEPAFWYAPDAANLAISDLRISNVLSDLADADTYAPFEESELGIDPSRVYAGVFGSYDGGWNYRVRSATTDEFVQRDTTASWPNIRKAARANARGDRYLETLHEEEEVIRTAILVPPANVCDIHAGDMIEVRFSHFPGYEDFRQVRILSQTVTFVTPAEYQIDLTLSPLPPVPPDILIAIINTGGPGVDLSSAPADGSDIEWTHAEWTGEYYEGTQFPGPGGPGGLALWWRPVTPGESASVLTVIGGGSRTSSCWVYQLSGVTTDGMDTTGTSDAQTNPFPVLSSPSAASNSVWFTAAMFQRVSYGQFMLIDTDQGTEVFMGNGANSPSLGHCADDDGAPPGVYIGYDTGTGTLALGGEITCSGATPDYNIYGRGWGGFLFPIVTSFSIVQSGFQSATGADVVVTLPSPP